MCSIADWPSFVASSDLCMYPQLRPFQVSSSWARSSRTCTVLATRASYLINPSAFIVSRTAGRAPTRSMKALMFGHLPRSILKTLVQLSTPKR